METRTAKVYISEPPPTRYGDTLVIFCHRASVSPFHLFLRGLKTRRQRYCTCRNLHGPTTKGPPRSVLRPYRPCAFIITCFAGAGTSWFAAFTVLCSCDFVIFYMATHRARFTVETSTGRAGYIETHGLYSLYCDAFRSGRENATNCFYDNTGCPHFHCGV